MNRRFPGPPRHRTAGGRRKKTKASLMIASLNIRGIGNPNAWHPNHKWHHVNQLCKDNRTGILVVVESHLSATRHTSIQNLFGRRLEVIFSEDPITPNAKGVAFVINKDLVSTDNIRTWEIIPGRAMMIEVETHKDKKVVVLGVYAPNAPGENADFWRTLREYFEHQGDAVPSPDIMAGDTNIVEEAIDRLPAHTDSEAATTQLDLLLTKLRMVDGWRKTYPTTCAYTYSQQRQDGTGSHSRIDRVYIRRDKYVEAYDWQMKTVGVPTDHRMVSVRIVQGAAPTTGPGRWVWPTHINGDKILVKFIHDRGTEILAAVERAANWPIRDAENDIQILWARFQADIRAKARERAKILVPKADREIDTLEKDMKAALNDPNLSEEEVLLSAAVFTEKLAKIHIAKHEKSRISAQIRNRLEGEVIGRYWSALN
ncbi:Endonuclease/exonuclease/phosphatase, partial [Mycena epipterygia]